MRPSSIIAAAGFAALPILSGSAWAQANRTFVSGHGEDTNPCTLAAPCRSFAQALSQTNAGGEITVLDSAGYGALTIDKSVTITNPGGVEAGITATAGQTAITINPSSSITVTLRGLTLEGAGVGANGIAYGPTTRGTLNIIDCVVKDFTGVGIAITPSFSGPTTQAHLLIANSLVLNNAGSGIEIVPQNSSTHVVYAIDGTTAAGNGTSGNDAGILVDSGSGFLNGTISLAQVHGNNIGANFIGNGFATLTAIKNSVLSDDIGQDLINSSSGLELYLLDSNQISQMTNNDVIRSDGTNDTIFAVGGNPLTEISRQ